MSQLPPCRELGPQCRALRVTLRVGSLDDGPASLDHEATWLLGHTEQITFLELWDDEGDLYAEAILHVPCRYLRVEPGAARCTAHGFVGRPRRRMQRPEQWRQLGGDRFVVVDDMELAHRALPGPPRSLPVLDRNAPDPAGNTGASATGNPCEGVPCQTADHRRGAACCRDLQVEIMCTRRQRRLETLVRSRRSPYLCKVSRPGDFSIEAEMISACAYLQPGGVACTLHGRRRTDGRAAKPDLCSEWPPKNQGLHPGCIFAPRKRRRLCKKETAQPSP